MKSNNETPTTWIVGQDEVGRAVLEWVDNEAAVEPDDPGAILTRLKAPPLSLADDDTREGYDPYNSGAFTITSKTYDRGRGKREAFARWRRTR